MNRALLVGINNYPTAPLNGCVNDVTDMAGFLVDHCSFRKNEISLLVNERATRIGILERLGLLLTGIQSGDRIFFHFSGHGVQLPTRNPQGEWDGLDEVICPYEFNWTEDTTLRDKEFASIFSSIPKGVLFTWVCDSCHSEDVHKMMANPSLQVKKRTIDPPADIAWGIETAQEKNIIPFGIRRIADGNVLLVSGCKSDETSADAKINGKFNGALTYHLLQYLKDGGLTRPMSDVIGEVNKLIHAASFEQHPQLNGSDDLKKRFFIQ